MQLPQIGFLQPDQVHFIVHDLPTSRQLNSNGMNPALEYCCGGQSRGMAQRQQITLFVLRVCCFCTPLVSVRGGASALHDPRCICTSSSSTIMLWRLILHISSNFCRFSPPPLAMRTSGSRPRFSLMLAACFLPEVAIFNSATRYRTRQTPQAASQCHSCCKSLPAKIF